ncbi:MAG: hypothetical protein KGI50_03250 [Patescibacteria group bacterium]|nr:hypothetical protein [Patescibacteria group bacterium]MDE2438308.1 hypothetical protein [Patescibacteria group bacterium]
MEKKSLSQLVQDALGVLGKRSRVILEKRYGLKTGKFVTLEAIGHEYSITRERVRQIEAAALASLKKHNVFDVFEASVKETNAYLAGKGGIAKEDVFLAAVAPYFGVGDTKKARQLYPYFYFVLEQAGLKHFPETEEFHAAWYRDAASLARAKDTVAKFQGYLEEVEHPLAENVIADHFKQFSKKGALASEEYLHNLISLSKLFGKNVFGEFGLVSWKEIAPRGARDKAFLVLKRHAKPLHFRHITQVINEAKFAPKKSHPLTVHNELIKDPRFVLVGRGVYALKEWGFEEGTVRDVLQSLLTKHGPLQADSLTQMVKAQRLVKENTILLNLQNRQHFQKNADGTYSVRG